MKMRDGKFEFKRMHAAIWLAAWLVVFLVVPIASDASPILAGCPVFPDDNVWNAPIDNLPVDPNSSLYISTIGETTGVHPDFGSGIWDEAPIGIPYNVVPGSQPKADITFTYADESDPGPYPIPPSPLIEGGPQSKGDRHVLVVDQDTCLLYESWSTYPNANGTWRAGSGAIFNLRSNTLREEGWTSSDAAGLPVLAGLARYDEVVSGEISHALRFTAPGTRREFIWPARHYASDLTADKYPPMGQRFRLKASFDLSGFSTDVQVILRALKKYGMILADNGSPWYISGVPDPRWNDDVLVSELRRVKGSDFEAVDESSLMVNRDSGQVRPQTPAPNSACPDRTVRLIFVHHSTGQAWLADDHGKLGVVLRNNRYFVTDTNYGWGPDTGGNGPIGSYTDIGHWWLWFRSDEHDTYLNALYDESEQHSTYSRLEINPGGPNEIIMFKSCFPNSALRGGPYDPVPHISLNPLRGQSSGSPDHTVANAKSIYVDLLKYFRTKRDKLFIVVAAPPLTSSTYAANARAFNQWLVNRWLKRYPFKNVFVFDLFNVLTTNGGSPDVNDLNRNTGNHHRLWNGAIQHKITGDDDGNPNVLEYPIGDDHPTSAGDLKATSEFIKLLNVAYNRWRPALGEALDNTSLTWTTGGAVKWFGETATGFSSGNGAQSGAISHGESSWLRTTLTGPGILTFRWKVSSEADHDLLKLLVDGKSKGSISGSTDWTKQILTLGAGTHVVRWIYEKDAGINAGLDAAWVDKVEWTGS
jgi:hypothetical protein